MSTSFNRGTGLIIIEVRNSNPNGDPDQESDPRTLDVDGRGVISPVSYKRKLRDIVLAKGEALALATKKLKLGQDGDQNAYGILEERGRRRDDIKTLDAASFKAAYWDARVFGNTFLESLKDDKDAGETSEASTEKKPKAPKTKGPDLSHFISTGAVQFGVGISVAPVTTDRMTLTNKSGVEEGKDRGMAPLGFRVVRHGIYIIPFFVNPAIAAKTGMTNKDLELLQFLIPYAYSQTSSAIRPFIDVLHAWYVEHKSPLGSCPDGLIVDALTPTLIDPDKEPVAGSDYEIPTTLKTDLQNRVKSITDLCNPQE
jgi:CRISPR/Cas system type I-B associated protein Csh2 (Cas7 group RAMP superfamily)